GSPRHARGRPRHHVALPAQRPRARNVLRDRRARRVARPRGFGRHRGRASRGGNGQARLAALGCAAGLALDARGRPDGLVPVDAALSPQVRRAVGHGPRPGTRRARGLQGAVSAKLSSDAVARYHHAVLLQGRGDAGGAALAYEQAVRLAPGFAEAWSNLGNVYRQLGRRDDALRAYDAAILAKPDFAAVYCNLGVLLIELERHTDATRALEVAIRLQPEMPEAHANLGQALRRDRQYAAAIA